MSCRVLTSSPPPALYPHPATYGVGGTGASLTTEGVMNFAKTTGAFTHSNAEVRDSARVRIFVGLCVFVLRFSFRHSFLCALI